MSKQNQIENSIAKSLLSLINVPILGTALNDIIDFRGKLKQERLNTFTELLENYFSNHIGVNLESFQTVEFSDLFESVLKRVTLTSSLEKMKLYKAILVNQIENRCSSNSESEIYMDLINELSEIEIKVLFEYRKYFEFYQPLVFERNELHERQTQIQVMLKPGMVSYDKEMRELTSKIAKLDLQMKELNKINASDFFSISEDEFQFYKQRLFSKALLIDTGVGSIGGRPFGTMNITQFGLRFIDFIISTN
jgi:hypothetical protein